MIVDEEYILMTLGLIEFDSNTEYIRLTEQGKDFYYGDDAQAFGKSYKCRDIYAFVEKTHEHIHDKNIYDSDAPTSRCAYVLHRIMEKLENANTHIAEVELISKLIPHEFERALFYSIAKEMIDDDTTSLTYEVKSIFPRQLRRTTLNDFKDKNNSLQKQGFVEIERKSSLFGEEINLILTDRAKETLLGEDASLYINEVSDKQLLLCDKITEKKLFFSGELDEQLSLLRSSLDKDYYEGLRARLEENNLPKGIAVLLYGEPGTGKTESVMQIAKATGRAIMHVDISATKTCWFGESEKLIKKVFTDYRRL